MTKALGEHYNNKMATKSFNRKKAIDCLISLVVAEPLEGTKCQHGSLKVNTSAKHGKI